jgi:twitching motility protein PilT
MHDSGWIDPRRRRATDPPPDSDSLSFALEIDQLLEFVIETSASDLHITPGLPPMARIHGELVPIPEIPPLTPEMSSAFLDAIMTQEQRRIFDEERELDFSFGRRGLGRYRVNAFTERGDVAAAVRRIPVTPPTLEELGLPPVLREIAELRRGLVLVTGPAGSGKTTTLAALISQINSERTEHIITIEDPIEFVHRHQRSIVQQREVGRDTTEFARALRSALREDPDVLLIGEMRDLETIAAAVSAAETGHLVFATLHTNSAAQAVDRIIDVFPPDQQTQIRMQLSASLQAVLAQRLVPMIVGGRVCVMEVLLANEAMRNLIREGKTHQIDSAMQSGIKDGMIIFDMMLADLVRRGEVAGDVAVQYCNDPRSFGSRVSGGSHY